MKYIILLALSLFPAHLVLAGGATGVGGGGDALEARVDEVRADILRWIEENGALGLALPPGVTYEQYSERMRKILAPHAVAIGIVTLAEEQQTQDPDLKVSVDGQPKTCRGFVKPAGDAHIVCNAERLKNTPEAEQYPLIHHEYAGLAGLERNQGSSSDYQISRQLTEYLIPETVLRLSVKKEQPLAPTVPYAGSCVPSGGNAVRFFEIIATGTGQEVKDFLNSNIVARDAINGICENAVYAAIRSRKVDVFSTVYKWAGQPDLGNIPNSLGSQDPHQLPRLDNIGALPPTLFQYALMFGSKEIIQLMRGGLGYSYYIWHGFTPLIFAAATNTPDVVDFLLKYEKNINSFAQEGSQDLATALFVAAMTNSQNGAQVVRNLIGSGASVNAKNSDGETALIWAALAPRATQTPEVVHLLLAAGAEVDARGSSQSTALGYAVTLHGRAESRSVVLQLLAAGAQVNLIDCAGMTPLFAAASAADENQAAEMIRLLLAHGADKKIRASGKSVCSEADKDMTAFDFAQFAAAQPQWINAHHEQVRRSPEGLRTILTLLKP